jgi:anti-sigma B factor antagonist
MKTRREEPDIDVVELIGNLNHGHTLGTIEIAIRRLIREGARKLIIDVSQLRFADSAGIGMFISMNGEMEQAGGRMRIAGATCMLAKSFVMVHMDRVIRMDLNVEAARNVLTTSGEPS